MSTPANFKVCPRCNAALSLAAIECSVCHTSFVPATVQFEAYPRPVPPTEVDQSRWVVAMLLAFFLGIFGAHRFYMGYIGLGVAMLILTMIGILTMCVGVGFIFLIGTGIWALVDFIIIICNGVKMADGKALR